MTTAQQFAARHPRIREWSDERKSGNRLLVELKAGWRFNFDVIPTHTATFDRVREAAAAVGHAVPCDCAACVAELRMCRKSGGRLACASFPPEQRCTDCRAAGGVHPSSNDQPENSHG